jgi:hypothetical protein
MSRIAYERPLSAGLGAVCLLEADSGRYTIVRVDPAGEHHPVGVYQTLTPHGVLLYTFDETGTKRHLAARLTEEDDRELWRRAVRTLADW